ncbi:MAG: hypothetical protein ACP5IZ_10655 [Thermoprotei archaeon]
MVGRAVSEVIVSMVFVGLVLLTYVFLQPFLSRIINQERSIEEQPRNQAKIVYAFYPTQSGQTNLHIGILNDGEKTITVLYIIAGVPQNKITINQQIKPHEIVDISINGIIQPPAYVFFDDGSYLKIPLPTPPTYTTINA